jgi:hypothetical protein
MFYGMGSAIDKPTPEALYYIMAEGNGNITTNLIGLFLLIGSSWALYYGLMPWWAALGCDVLGIYLLIPNRMTGAGDYFLSLYAQFRGWNTDDDTGGTIEIEAELEIDE